MSSKTISDLPPGSVGWTKTLVHRIMGVRVDRISAPGGPGRNSVRVHLQDGRTVIATRRSTPARGETEAGLLQILSAAGAPVPRVFGFEPGLMVQEDLGRNRLSHAMVGADPHARLSLARDAIAALQACRAALDARPDVLARLPGLGTRQGWAEDFISKPFFMSGDLGIAVPAVDAAALAASLAHPPERFTRWDARLANAAVMSDGRIGWYDWDLFGRRGGVEDLSWIIADDYWRLPLEDTLLVLGEAVPDGMLRALALRMAVLVGAKRLTRFAARLEVDGWARSEDALRLDRLSPVPEVISDLTTRLGDLAARDPLTQGFTPWFGAAGTALLARASA